MTRWKKFSEVKPPENVSVLFRGFDVGFKKQSLRSGFYFNDPEKVSLHEEGHRCINLANVCFDELEWTEIPE